MSTYRSPSSLLAPLAVGLAIAGFTLVAAGAASATPATPKVTALKIHRTPSGPQKGAIAVIAAANYRGTANNDRTVRGTRSLAKIIVTLTSARRSITVSDTVRLTHGNTVAGGRPVRFDIRVPLSTSRLLGNDERVHVKATLTRTRSTTPGKRVLRATGGQAQMSFSPTPGDVFFTFTKYHRSPPPAVPVGFQQWQKGDEALICVTFWGSGYGAPNWYSIGLNVSATDASIGYVFPAGMTTEVNADGSFSFGSYLDQWVGGYAQVTTGPQLSGTIPTSILSNPVSSSTGPATLNVSPQTIGLPVSWTLGALTANEAAGVC